MFAKLSDGAKIALAILVAGSLLAIAHYFRPSPERYSFRLVNGEIQRHDTATGEMLILGSKGTSLTVHETDGKLTIDR